MDTRTKRLRKDTSSTASLTFHGQRLHVFAESSPAGFAPPDPTHSHFHAGGCKALKGPRDSDGEELCLSPFRSSGTGKRKRNVQAPCDDVSKKHRVMCTSSFVRLTPMDKLETGALLRAYSDVIFCHYALWRIGTRHGDINVAGMGWDSRKENGVLIDFDVLVGENKTSDENEIVNILPFRALDLLDAERLL